MNCQLTNCPYFLCLLIYSFFLKLIVTCRLCEGNKWFQCIGYDNMAYMDYMDLTVECPRKAVKLFPRYWPFVQGIHCSPVNSPHKGQWHGALMFSLICVWLNGWVNNREAGDLRCHCAHYDITIMDSYQHFLLIYLHLPIPPINIHPVMLGYCLCDRSHNVMAALAHLGLDKNIALFTGFLIVLELWINSWVGKVVPRLGKIQELHDMN